MNNYNSSRLAQDARKSSIGLIGRVAPAALEAPIAAAHCDSDLQNLSPVDLRIIRNRQLSALFAAREGVDMGLFITVVDAWDEVPGVAG